MKDAIHYYHELLAGEYLTSTQDLLASKNERLSVAGRPTCNVLRPYFIDEETYQFVRRASENVLNGIFTLGRSLISDPVLRRHLDLTTEEEAIVQIDTGYGAPDVSARLDGFLSADGEFHFVEYNADSPGGIGYGDALSELFSSIPILKAFGIRFPFRTVPVRSLVFEALHDAYHRWGGRGLPNIAIVDWRGAATYNEFLLFQQQFEKKGCRVKIAAPEELEYRNRNLFVKDFRVDLVYKRVIVGELLQRFALNHPLVDAVRERAVCMVNGFGVQMLFKKSLFALLSDPEYAHLFGPETIKSLARHIPWTRKVGECKTTYCDSTIDLIPFVADHADRFVLKPNGEYGGKGVVLGWECDQTRWSESLKEALAQSYVVQERVPIARESYPSMVNGKLHFEERYFDLDPYVWNGEHAEGCGVRLSRLPLLNVSAGGGSATPMFVLQRR